MRIFSEQRGPGSGTKTTLNCEFACLNTEIKVLWLGRRGNGVEDSSENEAENFAAAAGVAVAVAVAAVEVVEVMRNAASWETLARDKNTFRRQGKKEKTLEKR